MTLYAHRFYSQELVGICKWGPTLKPAASAEQLRCSLDLLRFWARLGLHKLHPEETAIMFSLFDDTMVQAMTLNSNRQLDLATIISLIKPV